MYNREEFDALFLGGPILGFQSCTNNSGVIITLLKFGCKQYILPVGSQTNIAPNDEEAFFFQLFRAENITNNSLTYILHILVIYFSKALGL